MVWVKMTILLVCFVVRLLIGTDQHAPLAQSRFCLTGAYSILNEIFSYLDYKFVILDILYFGKNLVHLLCVQAK